MKVLLIGSGGREHALAWKLAQSPRLEKLYVAPGNPGMAQLGTCLPIPATDIDKLLEAAQREEVDWTFVGPEAPLCDGITDRFTAAGLKVFGPSQAAAQLEGSKIFSKELMREAGVPTANFGIFTDKRSALKYVAEKGLPQVIKADGLAAGKGVFVCQTEADVNNALDKIFVERVFGSAGDRILIEDCLVGIEASFLVFSDGTHALPLAPAKDHKPIFDGDKGPNTGGMGAYSPTPTMPDEFQQEILKTVVYPTLETMNKRKTPFRGILYTGLMLTEQGPSVLEFNVRFGDPETQAILPRLKTDLIDIMEASKSGGFAAMQLEWDPRSCLCLVLSSGGYPDSYEKGKLISGLDTIDDPDTIVFHAGTKAEGDKIVTAGGRVLGVTSLGNSLNEAHQKAYAAAEKIQWDGMYYRKDIGK